MTVRTEKGFFKILNEILKVIITPWALELAEFREKSIIFNKHPAYDALSCKTCKIVKQLDTQKCPSSFCLGNWYIGLLEMVPKWL